MKIIKKAEALKLKLVPYYAGKSKVSEVNNVLRSVSFTVGKTLLVNKKEYTGKTPLGSIILQSFRASRTNRKFSTRKLADDKGWIVTRLK